MKRIIYLLGTILLLGFITNCSSSNDAAMDDNTNNRLTYINDGIEFKVVVTLTEIYFESSTETYKYDLIYSVTNKKDYHVSGNLMYKYEGVTEHSVLKIQDLPPHETQSKKQTGSSPTKEGLEDGRNIYVYVLNNNPKASWYFQPD